MIVSLVMPLYKPHAGWSAELSGHLAQVRRELPESLNLEFILVNDGTPESMVTAKELSDLEGSISGLKVVSYSPNRGKGYAVRQGVQAAAGENIIYTDFDIPFGLESIRTTLAVLDGGADIAAGFRDPTYLEALHCSKRSFITRTLRMLNRVFLPLGAFDAQAGLKGFNRRGRAVFLRTRIHSFLFDTEFLAMAANRRLKIENVPVSVAEGIVMSKKRLPVLVRESLHLGILILRSWAGFPFTLKGIDHELQK